MNGRELELLGTGTIELAGRVPQSSNLTFVAELTLGTDYWWAIYKPRAGERPLYDFEPGLFRRERAAYLLSEWLGWGIVPPTVIREDGPLGVGSMQWFVEADEGEHYFTLHARCPETHEALRTVALFDCVTNNTDRKSGHVLLGLDGRVWAIDHGLCFAADPKLRTVIWDFGGTPVEEHLLADIAPLADEVPGEVADLLDRSEVTALRRRVGRLLDRPLLPIDYTGRRYPWPLI